MRLVFLYGPPAAGKLTIAEKLATRTGLKILQNNLTNKAITGVFPFGSPSFNRINDDLRIAIIGEAAEMHVDLVFTFVYAHGLDDAFIQRVIDAVGDSGSILFVQLRCPRDVLIKRISNYSRKAHPKLTDRKVLLRLFETHDLETPIPFVDSLTLDTSLMEPEECVGRILQALQEIGP